MTPIEIAVNAACRVFCKQTDGPAFDELSPIQKFQVLEHVNSLVAPAILAYEEAKANGTDAGKRRKEEKPFCPHCYEDVEHEDDHLVGDKDVNCWYECPADKGRPVK